MARQKKLPESALRVRAARELRGLTQDALARQLQADGLPLRLLFDLENGLVPLRRAHASILSTHLDVPERWFLVPADELFPDPVPADPPAWLRTIVRRLERLERAVERT